MNPSLTTVILWNQAQRRADVLRLGLGVYLSQSTMLQLFLEVCFQYFRC